MKTLAFITGERRLVHPFELYDINDELRIVVCRSYTKGQLVRRLKKLQVRGYIAEEDMHLPFKRYDGTSIFCLKLPMLIKKLVKVKNISTNSVAVVSSNDSMSDLLFENIADIFRDFYIISTDYDFATQQAERLLCEYGIAAHTDEPKEMCDVEIFTGNDFCGLGRCLINFNTQYEVNHGYSLPVEIDSRAFSEALLECGVITERQLKDIGVTIGGILDDKAPY